MITRSRDTKNGTGQGDPAIAGSLRWGRFGRITYVMNAILNMLVPFAALTIGLWVATKIVKGVKIEGGFFTHLIVTMLFGAFSFFLGWLLFVVIGVLTIGLGFLFSFLTRLVVSAIVLRITDKFSKKLTVKSFWSAFKASFVMTLVGSMAEWGLYLLLSR